MSDKTTITFAPDGPVLIRNLQTLVDGEGSPLPIGKSVALCRCGASQNGPFCDGSHGAAGFQDADARPVAGQSCAPAASGPAVVCVFSGGPAAVRGDIDVDGFEAEGDELYLCRCGASANKPFCDGSHKDAGFEG